jgi:hypothetical protein
LDYLRERLETRLDRRRRQAQRYRRRKREARGRPVEPRKTEYLRCPVCGKLSRGQNFGVGYRGGHVVEMAVVFYEDGTFRWQRGLRVPLALLRVVQDALRRAGEVVHQEVLREIRDGGESARTVAAPTRSAPVGMPERCPAACPGRVVVAEPERLLVRVRTQLQEVA